MTLPGFDVRQNDELRSALTQVWLFVEHLNAKTACQVQKDQGASYPLQTLLLNERRLLAGESAEWSPQSTLIRLARDCQVYRAPDSSLIDAATEILLLPAKISRSADGHWTLKDSSNLARPLPPDLLTERLWVYSVDARYSFSTREVLPAAVAYRRRIKGFYWDEAFDPISILQNFLLKALGSEELENANFHIQRWIRLEFGIHFDNQTKYAISHVARHMNRLFYARSIPTREEIHVTRAATLGTALLIDEIGKVLRDTGIATDPKGALRQSIGIYLLLRFCRLLRCRYCWPVAGETDDDELVLHAFEDQQCVSALRSFEYSFLLARIFGSITDIPGLTFIFRGGLLPRTESGRTMVVLGPPGAGKTVFALQKIAGIASRGGLGIYFSLEETYELIVDRLVSFGFADRNTFGIRLAGEDVIEVAQEWKRSEPHKGLLILYILKKEDALSHDGSGDGSLVGIKSIISEIAQKLSRSWKWKALAIDSINAVEPMQGTGRGRGKRGMRYALNELVQTIEQNKYLGVVLGEAHFAGLESLPYLADTVIELGFYESKRQRWIEVTKCRGQNFHPGRHPCRIAEGKGFRIYPSLAAIQSSLRRRTNTTLSEHWSLQITEKLVTRESEEVPIAEKSSILVYGPENSGKTTFALELARAPVSRRSADEPTLTQSQPSSVLIVNFRTTERRFGQNIKADNSLNAWWSQLKYRRVRWYSPGENVGPEQVVGDVWRYIKESRLQGIPLERIVFDELESAEHILPLLEREPLFWVTLLQLVNTEAVTAIFVVGEGYEGSEVFQELKLGVDYIVRFERAEQIGNYNLRVEKRPDLRRVTLPSPPLLATGEAHSMGQLSDSANDMAEDRNK